MLLRRCLRLSLSLLLSSCLSRLNLSLKLSLMGGLRLVVIFNNILKLLLKGVSRWLLRTFQRAGRECKYLTLRASDLVVLSLVRAQTGVKFLEKEKAFQGLGRLN